MNYVSLRDTIPTSALGSSNSTTRHRVPDGYVTLPAEVSASRPRSEEFFSKRMMKENGQKPTPLKRPKRMRTLGWMWIRMGIGFIVSYPTPILLSNHTALFSYSSSVKRQIPDGEIRHCLQVCASLLRLYLPSQCRFVFNNSLSLYHPMWMRKLIHRFV